MTTAKPTMDYLDAIDEISASISQADAVVSLLMINGENFSTGFTLSHKLVIDALWAISNMLDRADDAIGKLQSAARSVPNT
jgi:hypothetical protein